MLCGIGQVGDGEDRKLVLAGELSEPLPAAHGSVVVGDLADHSDTGQTRQRQQVGGRFGVSGAHQHTPGTSTQRKDVPGAVEVIRARRYVGQCAHGDGAVGGRDAGAGIGVIDAHGERRLVCIGVVRHHQRQRECVGALGRHGRTHDAGAVAHDERHLLGRDQLGGPHQVAFVLPIGIIGHHDQLPSSKRSQGIVDRVGRGQGHRKRLLDECVIMALPPSATGQPVRSWSLLHAGLRTFASRTW